MTKSKFTREEIFEKRRANQGISHTAFAREHHICVSWYYRCLLKQEELTKEQLEEVMAAKWERHVDFCRKFPLYHPSMSGLQRYEPDVPRDEETKEDQLRMRCSLAFKKIGISPEDFVDTYYHHKHKNTLALR